MLHRFRRGLSAAAVAITLAGTGTGVAGTSADPEYLQRAEEHRKAHDLPAAIIELKNALAEAPGDARVRLLLGSLYLEQGDGAAAEKELRLARRLGVPLPRLMAGLAEAIYLQRAWQRLVDDVQPLTGMSAREVADVRALRGEAQFALRRNDEARTSLESALRTDPAAVRALLGSARLALSEQRHDQARGWLQRAVDQSLSPQLANDAWSQFGDLEVATRHLPAADAAYTRAIDTGQSHLGVVLRRGLVRVELQDYDGAAADLNRVAGRAPDHTLVHYGFGLMAYRQGRYAEAAASFSRALQRAPDNADASYYLAASQLALGQLDAAIDGLSRFLAEHPESEVTARLLGDAYLRRGDANAAAALIQPLLERQPDDAALLDLLGRITLAQGDAARSRELLARATELAPSSAFGRYAYGMSLLAAGDQNRGLEELQKAVELDPHEHGLEFGLSVSLLRAGRFDEAIAVAHRLQQSLPDQAEPLVLEGIAQAARQQDAEARAAFRRALALEPGHPRAAGALAALDLGSGDIDGARGWYRQILAHHPGHAPALMQLARLEARQGQGEAYAETLREAIAADPHVPQPYVLLARWQLRQRQPLLAVGTLVAIRAEFPEYPPLLLTLGLAQGANGESADAIGTLRRLIELQPQSAEARYALVAAHAQAGDAAGLRSTLAEALAVDNRRPEVLPLLERLVGLAGSASEAENWLEALLRERPDDETVLDFIGQRRYRQYGAPTALTYYAQLQRRQPQVALWVLREAEIRSGNREAAQAQALLERWLQAHPDDVQARFALGLIHLDADRRAPARAAFEAVLERRPDQLAALNNLAWLLREDDPQRALDYANRCLQLRPADPRLMDTLGEVLIAQRQYARAAEVLARAVARAPQLGSVRYRLALALSLDGRKDEARELLKSLLDAGQPFSERAEAQNLLTQIGG